MEVHQLGQYPQRCKIPATDKERAEKSLADKISKQWSKLRDTTKAELTRLQQETQGKDAEARAETRAQDILERLRAFGKWPQEHDYSPASSQEILTEAKLAHDLRKFRSAGLFDKSAEAEI